MTHQQFKNEKEHMAFLEKKYGGTKAITKKRPVLKHTSVKQANAIRGDK